MIYCPQYSFIQFFDEIKDCLCNLELEVSTLSDLSFYVNADNDFQIYLCDLSGEEIIQINDSFSKGWINQSKDLSELFACQDCFRLLIIENEIRYFSNVIRYDNKTTWKLCEYRSDTTTYFPFDEDSLFYNKVRLPIDLINKNPRTETEEYIDSNGWISNPYKQRRDVYDLDVNYVPIDYHKKIQVMLMHDVVIDNIPINETGDYQINYEESLSDENLDLHKASSEISEQDILLMRNY